MSIILQFQLHLTNERTMYIPTYMFKLYKDITIGSTCEIYCLITAVRSVLPSVNNTFK